MTKTKMDMLRVQLLEELEEPYRARWQQLTQEAEAARSQHNQLKYEYTFLKAEFEHEREEHHRIVEEMKMLHEKEVGPGVEGRRTCPLTALGGNYITSVPIPIT